MRSEGKYATGRFAESGDRHADRPGHGHRHDEGVDTVHQPAMAGDQTAGILHAETPLDPGFEQVARLPDHRQDRRQDDDEGPDLAADEMGIDCTQDRPGQEAPGRTRIPPALRRSPLSPRPHGWLGRAYGG